MTKADRINDKLAHLDAQLDALKRHQKVFTRVGGVTIQDLGEEVKFHQERRQTLADAATMTDDEIRARISALEATLPAGVIDSKYGDLRGVPLEHVMTISKIELFEVALGTHPGVS